MENQICKNTSILLEIDAAKSNLQNLTINRRSINGAGEIILLEPKNEASKKLKKRLLDLYE